MTIYYPDISHYQAGLTIQPATVAVCAKASEGTTFQDPAYADFASQAAAQGSLFFSYHFLHQGNADAQADFCYGIIGATPVMIDCEDPHGTPTVSDCVAFVHGIRARGGVCTIIYLPHWYWRDHLGSPDLAPFDEAGLNLVSSNYTTYSDTGPGWDPYGGVTPVIWQYTDNLHYGGHNINMALLTFPWVVIMRLLGLEGVGRGRRG